MALIIPQHQSLTYYANNMVTTVPSTAVGFGTAVTAGASNAKGTAVSLLTVTQDVQSLRVAFHGFSLTTANCSALADILIDPAGGTSWQVLVPNLFAGNTDFTDPDSTSSPNTTRWCDLPVFIPAGAAIGCQAATAHTSTIAGSVFVCVAGGNANPGAGLVGQSVEAIGVDTADSGGTAHTPGASSTFSSWTNFGSPLARSASGIIFSTQGEGDSAYSSGSYIFEFGVAGQIIGTPVLFGTMSTEITDQLVQQTFNPIALPAGTQLQVRGKAAGASPQAIDVGAWAVS